MTILLYNKKTCSTLTIAGISYFYYTTHKPDVSIDYAPTKDDGYPCWICEHRASVTGESATYTIAFPEEIYDILTINKADDLFAVPNRYIEIDDNGIRLSSDIRTEATP